MGIDMQESGEIDEWGQFLFNVCQRVMTRREVRRELGASSRVSLDRYRMPRFNLNGDVEADRQDEERFRRGNGFFQDELFSEGEMIQRNFEDRAQWQDVRYAAVRQEYGDVPPYIFHQPAPRPAAAAFNLRARPGRSISSRPSHSSTSGRASSSRPSYPSGVQTHPIPRRFALRNSTLNLSHHPVALLRACQ
jgi:hypothetical protein